MAEDSISQTGWSPVGPKYWWYAGRNGGVWLQNWAWSGWWWVGEFHGRQNWIWKEWEGTEILPWSGSKEGIRPWVGWVDWTKPIPVHLRRRCKLITCRDQDGIYYVQRPA